MTGSAADLRDLEQAECVYLLHIEGISTGFSTSAAISDGTYLTDRTSILPCLRLPKFTMGINPRKGTFTTSTAEFVLDEVAGTTLVELFATVRTDVEELETTIEAGSTALGANHEAAGKHVGTEFIGANGERMQYPHVPNWGIGPRHVGKLNAFSNEQSWVPVSGDPLVWAGRRFVLFRVFHNVLASPNDTSGVNWTAPANSDPVFFGTLLDAGTVRGRTWVLQVAGPESWLERRVGQGTWTTPKQVDAAISLESGEEDYIGAYTQQRSLDHSSFEQYGEDLFTTQAAGSSLAQIRTAMTNAVTNAGTALTGTDGEYTDEGEGSLSFSENTHQFRIQIKEQAPSNRAGDLVVIAHEKVWKALGYVFSEENSQTWGQNRLGLEDPYYIDAGPVKNQTVNFPTAGATNVPTDGYWKVRFSTWQPWNIDPNPDFDGTKIDNDGADVFYRPFYEGGTFSLYANPVGGQEFIVGNDPIYLEGQHDGAPMSDPDDAATAFSISDGVGSVDSHRIFAFFGPRRMATNLNDPEAEVVNEAQVARVSWNDSGGTVGENSEAKPTFVIEKWLNPRLYGFDRDKLESDWVGLANPQDDSDAIYCVPLNHFGMNSEGQDRNTLMMQRLLLSTGTSTGHSSFSKDNANTVDRGENDPETSNNPLDVSRYDWGLGIPEAYVQLPKEWDKEQMRLDNELRRSKVAILQPHSASEIASSMMEPLGWCWHLRDGRFGVFCPWDTIGAGEADIAITSAAYSAQHERPESAIPRQQLRVFAPIDSVKVSSSLNPLEGGTTYEDDFAATDAGARYRVQNVDHSVDASWLRTGQAFSWRAPLQKRWDRGFKWWGRRHFKIAGQKLQRLKGQKCWPGARVRYTDNWAVNPAGSYGITNFGGFVTKVVYDCETEEASVDFLIQDDGGLGIHYYSPIARAFHWDGTARRLYCYDDFYQLGYGHVDVEWFVEPSWSSVGGNMDVELYQYDGESWTGGIYNEVSTVNSEEGEAYIDMANAMSGGTFYHDRDTIVVPRDFANQDAAWVKALFAAIGNEDGEVNGDVANSVKFNGI